jgi:hypothetical protein
VTALWLSSLRWDTIAAVTNISFADDLQKDWQLVSLTVLPKETVITVRTTFSHAVPSPVGRDGLSIIAYPAIHSDREQAEFAFQRCLFVRVWDEATLSVLEANTDTQFEGRSFRRYTKSALLDLHSKLPIPGVHFHYQLNFSNEIVDIVCQTAPVVSLRHAVIQDKLAGEAQ